MEEIPDPYDAVIMTSGLRNVISARYGQDHLQEGSLSSVSEPV